MNVLHDHLKQAINSKCITQRQLAVLCDTTEVSVSRWVNGKRVPDADMLSKLCKVLDVSADYLLGLSEENEGIYRVKYERIKGEVSPAMG